MDNTTLIIAAILGSTTSVAVAILGAFVLPMMRERRITDKKKANLLNMLCADIRERLDRFDQFEPLLRAAIARMREDADYTPLIFDTDGLNGYVDWVAEKWLLPKSLAGQVLKFYNDRASLAAMIERTADERFTRLPQERRLTLYQAILAELRSTRKIGLELLDSAELKENGAGAGHGDTSFRG